jgi:hypothetical protein
MGGKVASGVCAVQRMRVTVVAALVLVVMAGAAADPVHAVNHLIVIDEVLGSWQGDNEIQFIELRMLQPDQNQLQLGAGIEIFDQDGDLVQQFTFAGPAQRALPGTRVLIGTAKLATLAGVLPDFPLDTGVLPPKNGRVCYLAPIGAVPQRIDCLAYGAFAGDNGPFGDPTPLTPDNRSLQRARDEADVDNARDFIGELRPSPENSRGDSETLTTLCGNALIDEGEECDGENLNERTCETEGFAGGVLDCAQCHLDPSACTDCGNAKIDDGEECDRTNLNDSACTTEGYTSGTLACAADCTFDVGACAELQIPGSSAEAKTCYLQWSVVNPASPVKKGRLKTTQRCEDGNAACDGDGVADGVCTFRVRLCFNREDHRVAKCSPRGVSTVELRRPSSTAGDATDQVNAVGLLAAVAGLGTSTVSGDAVTFSPVLETVDLCTDLVDISVPVQQRPGKRAKAGKRELRTIVADGAARRRDKDKIKLQCRPGG